MNEYDKLDLNSKEDIRKSNFYELNRRLFSSLQLDISNKRYNFNRQMYELNL